MTCKHASMWYNRLQEDGDRKKQLVCMKCGEVIIDPPRQYCKCEVPLGYTIKIKERMFLDICETCNLRIRKAYRIKPQQTYLDKLRENFD